MVGTSDSSEGLVKLTALTSGHTLSYAQQPYFGLLLELMRKNEPITLVIGAGTSIDSGLATWPQLLRSLARLIPDQDIAEIAAADESDVLRKAENIKTLVLQTTSESAESMVRRALMPDDKELRPGELTNSIARLVASNPRRFRILTTNFDPLLETALGEVDVPHVGASLDEFLSDGRYIDNDGNQRVIHLHGRVAPNDTPPTLRPIILAESEFLRHGDRVKQALRQSMSGVSAVIFIGVSLTDPNLVGPLWDIENGTSPVDGVDKTAEASVPKFVFSVVSHPGGRKEVSFDMAAEIARYKAIYLDDSLKAKPVLLKSYSQLVQACSELSLASAEPMTYTQRPRRGRSTRYGVRFTSALDKGYKEIGARTNSEYPNNASKLSDDLYSILYGRGGLEATISSALQSEGNIIPPDEHFGLFLWLRRRMPRNPRAPYEIHLVGASTYAHRETWSFVRREAVSFNSRTIAARSLFLGGVQMSDLPAPQTEFAAVQLEPNSSPIWRGIVGLPLMLRGYTSDSSATSHESHMYDRLAMGAITINTTHPILDGRGVQMPDRQSAFRLLRDHGKIHSVVEAANDAVARLLWS